MEVAEIDKIWSNRNSCVHEWKSYGKILRCNKCDIMYLTKEEFIIILMNKKIAELEHILEVLSKSHAILEKNNEKLKKEIETLKKEIERYDEFIFTLSMDGGLT